MLYLNVSPKKMLFKLKNSVSELGATIKQILAKTGQKRNVRKFTLDEDSISK